VLVGTLLINRKVLAPLRERVRHPDGRSLFRAATRLSASGMTRPAVTFQGPTRANKTFQMLTG
jgi:hypothetical protein